MKPFFKVVLVVGAAAFVSMIGVTACVASRYGVHLGFASDNFSAKAERTDNLELEIESGRTLSAATPRGNVHVRAEQGQSGHVRAVVHAWAPTQAEADDQLSRTSIVLDKTPFGTAVRIAVKEPSEHEAKTRGSSAADFEIVVPAGVLVDLESNCGNVRADGEGLGGARAESSYGDVAVENVKGEVVASSRSGSVAIAKVLNGKIDASSGYGDVALADAEGTQIALKTGSGSVRLERVRAERVSARSGYGNVTLVDVKSETDVDASSKSGDVRLSSVSAATVQLKSGYGKVQAKNVKGEISAESSSGDVVVSNVEPSVAAKTGYGDVEVDGVLTALNASSSSGNVTVKARAGSKVDSEWKVQSKYGRVELGAPVDASFDLVAKTGYGEIELGYSVQLDPGVVHRGKEIKGKVNGGGRSVRLESSSGNVRVRPIDE
jgi:DUF4097 and DUF4098 domain-containing protein YvlB